MARLGYRVDQIVGIQHTFRVSFNPSTDGSIKQLGLLDKTSPGLRNNSSFRVSQVIPENPANPLTISQCLSKTI